MFDLYKSEYQTEVMKLIDIIYREYGDELCIDGCDSDLLDIENNYMGKGGAFWIYKVKNKIVATVAVKKENKYSELKRFYLHKDFRGSGIADELLEKAEEWSKNNNFEKLFFWSDTRFTRAHSYYEKRGYQKGKIRKMDDGNIPYEEFYFEKQL